MGTNELILRKVQAGLESTRGTSVAATRKVYAICSPSYEKPLAAMPDQTGTYAARRRPAYGRERVGLTATDAVSYEDLAWWFQMALKGGVSGVAGATTNAAAYTYTFSPSTATDDLKSATFEVGEPGNPYEIDQCMVNSWTLRIDPDNDAEPTWMLDLEMLGRTMTPTSYTAALADRTTELVLARGTKIYVDEPGGTIGGTQVTGRLINASITGNNSLTYKAFMEDEAAMAANRVGRGERFYDAQFTVEFDSDNDAMGFDNLRAGTKRLIRIQREGAVVTGVGATAKKKVEIDMHGYMSAISWGDRAGNMTATISLQAFYDAAAGFDLKATVINELATLA
jgi:hypothetical protein